MREALNVKNSVVCWYENEFVDKTTAAKIAIATNIGMERWRRRRIFFCEVCVLLVEVRILIDECCGIDIFIIVWSIWYHDKEQAGRPVRTKLLDEIEAKQFAGIFGRVSHPVVFIQNIACSNDESRDCKM